jgi:hypothetical protein
MSAVVKTETLKELADLKRTADLERWLESQNIRFFRSKKGPWTTIGLIEAAQGLIGAQNLNPSDDEIL